MKGIENITVGVVSKYLHNIKHCGMRILDIQNLQLSHNIFYISINDLNLENDVWYIETSINLYFDFSYSVFYLCLIEMSPPECSNPCV